MFAARHRVLTVDLLGHGHTESPGHPPRYAIEHAARDLTELLDQLVDHPVYLLGYSMGGRLALYLGLHYPDRIRSLILESASPGLESASERLERQVHDDELAEQIERDGIEVFIQYWENIPLFETQKRLLEHQRQTLHQQRLHNNAPGLANSLRGMGTGVQPALWDQLGQLKRPVLLMTGAEDRKFTAINQRMAQLTPQAELVTISEAGHTVHLEAPQAFDQAVLRFLDLNAEC